MEVLEIRTLLSMPGFQIQPHVGGGQFTPGKTGLADQNYSGGPTAIAQGKFTWIRHILPDIEQHKTSYDYMLTLLSCPSDPRGTTAYILVHTVIILLRNIGFS